jgi:tetratricopeptide (TPR) repeat protein
MKRKSVLFLIAAFLIAFGPRQDAFAQKNKYHNKANDPVAKLGYTKKLRWADGLFKSGSYYNAIDYYKQLMNEQPRNPYIVYQLAECSWFMRDYVPAAKYYGYAYSLSSALYPEAIYKQAEMLKMQGKYNEAIAAFQKFMDDNPKKYKKLKKRAVIQIEGCKMAINSMNNPIPANVNNLGPNVNTAYTELSPYPLGDTALLFATMNSNEPVVIGQEKRSEYVSRFMVAKKFKQVDLDAVDSFQWALPFNDGSFNDPKFHTGNGCYIPGGDRFYFTRCLEDKTHNMICHIFVSKFKDERWSEPQEIGNNVNVK